MSDLTTPNDQGGLRKSHKKSLAPEWDAPYADRNLAKLKRQVNAGWKYFWSKPGRVEPKDYSFGDLVRSGTRKGRTE
jgi:hypothetical protein